MKKLTFLFFIFTLLFVSTTEAQKRKTSKRSTKSKVVKKEKIISAGVVNGRAIKMEIPDYPVVARYAKIYGTVKVLVLIDEQGNVTDAKVVSGNPLLFGNTISAALNSKFEPITIGGNPVKVSGIIYYYFDLCEYTWLDIGVSLKSFRLNKMLPFGFDEEKQLYETYLKTDAEERDAILDSIRASIENKIRDDEKNLWLFQVGILTTEIAELKYKYNEKKKAENIDTLKTFLLNSPKNISPLLIEKLKLIVELSETKQSTEKFWTQMNYIWDNVSLLGR